MHDEVRGTAEGPRSVERFLDAVTGASIIGSEVFASDAILDATTPDWRFTIRGGEGIESEFATWYADPGTFESLRRVPVEGGELIEFVLDWVEDSGPHRCHQMHLLQVDGDGLITRDTAFCGGRWDSDRMAEMARAAESG